MIAKVTAMKRRKNTVNGNPVWDISMDNGMHYLTKRDAGFTLEISENWVGRTVRFETDNHNRLTDVRLVKR